MAICLLSFSMPVFAQQEDSVALLKKVTITGYKKTNVFTAVAPVQQLNKETLSKLNSVSVADAVKYFSGVVVKDYGGIGGLKTISVRSLGANHTGIIYDGIMVSDAQGGQIDLGRFSLDNIESVQLFSNGPVDILLPARSYSSASVIALVSSTSNSTDRPKNDLTVKFKAGSFGFINPAISYKTKLGNKFSTSLNAEYQIAKSDYTFRDYETGRSKHTRNNSDIKTYRLEYDAAYTVNDSNQLKFKAYYYNSKRGLPGAVIFYSDFADERLNNESFFSQASWQKTISRKSRILISAKYADDYKYYLDPTYLNNTDTLENKFYQKEFYLSVAYQYRICSSLSASYAADNFINTLKRTDKYARNFANPQRNSLLNTVSIQWKKKRYEVQGNLLHSHVKGKVEQGPAAKTLNELTPALAASVQLFNKVPVRLRGSYKKIFRVPSFDDLYYTNVGNTNLRPEYADLFNLGITVNVQSEKIIRELIVTADAFYSKVKDKILAVPRTNLFQWTMLNIAAAKTTGVDLALHLNFKKWKSIKTGVRASYSYQKAIDVSNPSSSLYKTQLPYQPLHSGSVNLFATIRQFGFSYNVISSSYRYRLGEPIPENIVQGWAVHDVSLSYKINAGNKEYRLIAEANNIYNKQYDIIKFYPMPRFNYRFGIIASIKK
jgi:outer membrane cobalamin receptor